MNESRQIALPKANEAADARTEQFVCHGRSLLRRELKRGFLDFRETPASASREDATIRRSLPRFEAEGADTLLRATF